MLSYLRICVLSHPKLYISTQCQQTGYTHHNFQQSINPAIKLNTPKYHLYKNHHLTTVYGTFLVYLFLTTRLPGLAGKHGATVLESQQIFSKETVQNEKKF